MKSNKTKRRDTYKASLKSLIDKNPDAKEVAKRYKVMAFVLSKEWGNLIMSIVDKNILYDFLHDVTYVDRLIRKQTEGFEEEEKQILSETFQLEELPKM